MRNKFLPLLLVAGMTFGGAAFAGTTATTSTATTAATTTAKVPAKPATTTVAATPGSATGTIKLINTKGGYVVLSDGWKYHVGSNVSLKDFKVGEKVSVSYTLKGKKHEVTSMTAA